MLPEPRKPQKPTQIVEKEPYSPEKEPPTWMVLALKAMGIFSIIWGGLAIYGPSAFFFEPYDSPMLLLIWRYVGVIGLVFGVGYYLASYDLYRSTSFLTVSFWIKVFVLVLLVYSWFSGIYDRSFFQYAIAGELIWLPLFVPIIWWLFRESQSTESNAPSQPVELAMTQFRIGSGHSLWQLSFEKPLLLVFLRHFGCTFCREALSEIARKRANKQLDSNTKLVFVHMGREDEAANYMAKYGLENEARISDRNCELYRAFDLQRGNLRQTFGIKSWIRGAWLLFRKGIAPGLLVGDGFRMPGVFLVYQGVIVKEFRHKSVADVPNYEYMSACRVSDV